MSSATPVIATAAAVAQQANTQAALATKLVKLNAEADQSLVALLQEAAENLEQVSQKGPLAPGTGAKLDVTA